MSKEKWCGSGMEIPHTASGAPVLYGRKILLWLVSGALSTYLGTSHSMHASPILERHRTPGVARCQLRDTQPWPQPDYSRQGCAVQMR
ncbi:hypothetical protein H4582DRAFT_1984294 [Lactarius indigo]|nr:hypothetical protein H4582DRAFT_1984294 [Lactarius indigo]